MCPGVPTMTLPGRLRIQPQIGSAIGSVTTCSTTATHTNRIARYAATAIPPAWDSSHARSVYLGLLTLHIVFRISVAAIGRGQAGVLGGRDAHLSCRSGSCLLYTSYTCD